MRHTEKFWAVRTLFRKIFFPIIVEKCQKMGLSFFLGGGFPGWNFEIKSLVKYQNLLPIIWYTKRTYLTQKVSRENGIEFVTPKWGKLFDHSPPNYHRGLNFCRNTSPTEARWEKNFSALAPLRGEIWGQRKNFPSRPLKIPSMYSPKIFPTASTRCPLHVARAKKCGFSEVRV